MSATSSRLALAALACLIAAPASAQLIQRKDLSYAMAKTIAENALADCKARGYAVSVVVVDRGGDTMVALRADDAGPHTMENARRKAYTARTFRMTTEEFVKRMETEPVRRAADHAAPRDRHRRRRADQGRQRRDRRSRPLRLTRRRRALRQCRPRQSERSAAVRKRRVPQGRSQPDRIHAMMKRETFAIANIYVPAKRRATLDAAKAREIAESMLKVGQQTPIMVRQGWRPVRPGGRPSPAGSLQATRRGDDSRLPRAGDGCISGGAVTSVSSASGT